MHPTRNDLSAKIRARLERLLNARLADALDLESASKQAHWNVKGPQFIALHELFDDLHTKVEEHVDTLAERITALGGTADLFTTISRDADKYLWFLEAHLQGER